MKKTLTKRFGLALLGLVLVSAGSIGSAQDIKWTYDTVIPTWNNWYNVNAIFAWSTNDAATNPASGSFQFDLDATGSQSVFFSGFNPDGTANPVDLNNYSSVQFDILVDGVNSPLNGGGNYGTIQSHVFNNYSTTFIGQYTIPAEAGINWQHVSLPIPPGLGTWGGPAFWFQDWVGPTYPNNPVGNVTYYIDNLTYVAKPPTPGISVQPVSQELYAHKTANWSVGASGGQPLSYQWRKGSTPLVDGATGSGSVVSGSTTNALSIVNVSAADVANYSVVITNTFGSITSSVVSLAIVAPAGAEAAATLALNPVAFYELNETNNPASNSPAFDHIGGFAGSYANNAFNAYTGIQGPRGAGFPGFTGGNNAANVTANSGAHITLPAFNLNTNTATITAWINPNSYIQDAAIIMNRYGSTSSGFVWAGNDGELGYNWANNGATWGWRTSGCIPPTNAWSFVALVITPDDATVYSMNTNSIVAGNNPVPNAIQAFEGPTLIGIDGGTTGRTFDGSIDDVVIYNYSLTADQLQRLYFAGVGGPTLYFDGTNLSWQPVIGTLTVTLLEATSLTGPWTPVIGATSPWSITHTGSAHYYKLLVQ